MYIIFLSHKKYCQPIISYIRSLILCMKVFGYFLIVCSLSSSCSVSKRTTGVSINSLKYLGEYVVPYDQQFKGTTVGGLSGIDYDAAKDLYYLICDDRSERSPARFYTAKIKVTSNGIANVEFVNVTTLLKPDGKPYPDTKMDPANSPDPEGIRYNPVSGKFIWTSEGERIIKKEIVIQQPAITIINKAGQYVDTFALAPQMRNYPTERGLRRNSSYEGLTFADNYKSLFVSAEEPLYEDGAPAGLSDAIAYTRLIKYDMGTRKPVAQYAYDLEAVAHAPVPANEFMINGITDVLSIGPDKLLVIERSYSKGVQSNTVRAFVADLTNATDISGIISLTEQYFKYPVSKKLLINMDDLGIEIDNIEGVTFGPDLPNGHKTLIFVSDNNFAKEQKTQFLLFEVN